SMRVRATPPECAVPTAQIISAFRAETASRELSPSPRLGLGTILHEVPSQCSMRVWETLTGWAEPTAQTSPDPTTATAARELSPVPLFGLEARFQPGLQGGVAVAMEVAMEVAVRDPG